MDKQAQDLIERIIMEDEGGWKFTDRVDDAGGPTYGGMTFATWNRWRTANYPGVSPRTIEDFRKAAREGWPHFQANIRVCYYDEFYRRGHVDEVPSFAQYMYFSALVNFGDFKEVLKWLQMAWNTVYANERLNHNKDLSYALLVDGHWGPKTAKAMEFASGPNRTEQTRPFKLAFSDACIERYIRIVQRNADAWADYAEHAEKPGLPHFNRRPKVRQWKNLTGWFNRARSYRSK